MTKEEPTRSAHVPSLSEIVDEFGLTRAHYLALVLVVLGGLFEVFEQTIVPSLGPSLERTFGIQATQVSLLTTVTLLAIVVGGVAGGIVADRFGRRRLLSVNLLIYCFGSLFSALVPNYSILILARIITGIGVGGEIAVGLTLLSEITPTKFRGIFVSLFNTVSAGIGIFLAFGYTLVVLGPFSTLIGAGSSSWRWVFGLLAIPAILVVFFRLYLPESPRYLLRRGDIQAVNRTLTHFFTGKFRLRPEETVSYVDERTAAVSESGGEGIGATDVKELLGGGLRQRTLALGTAAFMAWAAQFSVLILMPIILVGRGHNISGSLVFVMVQNIGGLFGACVASYGGFALPRRLVVPAGCAGALVSILAFAFLAHGNILILVIGFIFQVFLLMANTTIWLWAPEIFPTRLRGSGTAVVVNIGFVGGALVPLGTSALYQAVGVVGAFALVAGMYVVAGLAAVWVTETHGRSLETLHRGAARKTAPVN